MGSESVAAIDVGTQAARCLVVDLSGHVLASGSEPLRTLDRALPDGWSEQDPEEWWRATCAACRTAVSDFGRDRSAEISAVAVDSTSGTIVPVDEDGSPLRRALMYNDVRAIEETEVVRSAGEHLADKLGYSFQPSFALPKILWIKRNEPEVSSRAACFLHAADFIVSRLSGGAFMSDTSNALKAGYDLVDRCWPTFIEDELELPLSVLPEVMTPGEAMAVVSPKAAEATTLPAGGQIVAGCTDGTAAFIASGAARPGDVNSNLGTTLVVRAVSERLVRDPAGRIYSHLHPDGWWLPGGASSSGGEIVLQTFGERVGTLEDDVPGRLPTDLLVYPLTRTGERLPFVDAEAAGFTVGQPASDAEHLAGMMEGVGYLERWVLELLEELGAGRAERVYVTGGAARSPIWLSVRASILGLPLHRPATAESAFGAAILAASGTLGGVTAATEAMVRPDITVDPDPALAAGYHDRYARFRAACAERGYGTQRR